MTSSVLLVSAGVHMHATQTKADQNASELAHVLRRERAGQGSIADAQAEVEELKGELGHMREAFARLVETYDPCHEQRYIMPFHPRAFCGCTHPSKGSSCTETSLRCDLG